MKLPRVWRKSRSSIAKAAGALPGAASRKGSCACPAPHDQCIENMMAETRFKGFGRMPDPIPTYSNPYSYPKHQKIFPPKTSKHIPAQNIKTCFKNTKNHNRHLNQTQLDDPRPPFINISHALLGKLQPKCPVPPQVP